MKSIVRIILTLISKFIPVNNKMIVLESNPSYGDNTGALYNEMIKLGVHKSYQIYWLIFDGRARQDGFSKELIINETAGLVGFVSIIRLNYYYMRAKYSFHSHRSMYLFKPREKQYIVNLTHGTPIKDTTGRHSSQRYITHITSPSEFAAKLKKKTYDNASDKIFVTGFPRNDYLLRNNFEKDNTIVWLPTYRKHINALKNSEHDIFPLDPSHHDLSRLDRLLSEFDYRLIIKPHPAQLLKIDLKDFKNIKMISDDDLHNQRKHLYEILSKSSLLITDYSSVYVDYLLLDNPIIFTFDDLEEYSKNWGFTVDDINEFAPGYKVKTMLELIDVIEKFLSGFPDDHRGMRQNMRLKFNEYNDSNSSLRVLKLVGIVK